MTDTPQHLRTRADGGRAVEYPPAPEPLTVPVYDNHTHLEIADGALPLDVHEHLERAASVGVAGAVQVGTDVATSRWSADVAAREPRLLAAVALHPNEAPELEASGALDDALAVIDELGRLVGMQRHGGQQARLALRQVGRPAARGDIGADLHGTRDADRRSALEVLVHVERQGAVGDLEMRVVVVHGHDERLGGGRVLDRPAPVGPGSQVLGRVGHARLTR